MKRTSLLLLSLFLASCNESSQQVFVDQGIPSEMIDVESQWTREDGCISGEVGIWCLKNYSMARLLH